jgi:hypothetical protein
MAGRQFTEEQRQRAQEALRKARAEGRKPPSRREKMSAFASSFAGMREEYPRWALPLIARAETGSLPAAITIKCLECSAWSKTEVRDCQIISCGLYAHRPYQTMKGRNTNDAPTSSVTSTTTSDVVAEPTETC